MGTEPTEPHPDQKPSGLAPVKSADENMAAAFREIMDTLAGSIYAVTLCSVIASFLLFAIAYGLVFFLRSGEAPIDLKPANGGYGFGVLFMLPFLQGFLTGYWGGRRTHGPWRYILSSLLILAIDIGIAYLFLREGSICLVMGFPLFWATILSGMVFGSMLSHFLNRTSLHATVLPLAVLIFARDAVVPPNFANAISDAVTIDAPPNAVWHYVVQYPINEKPPEYWLWKIGLPEPVQSVAEAKKVGAARECRFTNNVVFKEKITKLVPGKVLTFDITEQPRDPEIIGHFSLDKGQMLLEPNKDGTTTIIATSWYHLYVSPAFYFDWWAADIVRNVHFRVLNHIKELAEADNPRKNIPSSNTRNTK